MTRVAFKEVAQLGPDDIVWEADRGHGRRVALRVALVQTALERSCRVFQQHVVFFTDGTHTTYERGHTRVQVVTAALARSHALEHH